MPTKEDQEEKPEEKILMEVDNPESYKLDLKQRAESFINKPLFKVGDIITWKAGMRNKTIPDIGIPGIVLNIFYPVLIDEDREVTSTYYNDILDIQVGFISKEDEFIVFAQDSRRFELYKY